MCRAPCQALFIAVSSSASSVSGYSRTCLLHSPLPCPPRNLLPSSLFSALLPANHKPQDYVDENVPPPAASYDDRCEGQDPSLPRQTVSCMGGGAGRDSNARPSPGEVPANRACQDKDTRPDFWLAHSVTVKRGHGPYPLGRWGAYKENQWGVKTLLLLNVREAGAGEPEAGGQRGPPPQNPPAPTHPHTHTYISSPACTN